MSATVEQRLSAAEAEIARLSQRVTHLERPAAASSPERRSAPLSWRPPEEPAAPEAQRPVIPDRRRVDLEELLGGRVLALVGGVAVLIGLAFFVALAIDRGWIGETARIAMAFAGSGLLVAAGVALGERRGRTQASLAIVGTGIAGLFLSLTAATAHYGLVPVGAAFPIAFAIGALGTVVALRWDSRTLGGLALLGALAAPVLVGAEPSAVALGFLCVALAAAAAVLVWRRWEWLRVGAFAVAMPQVAYWALAADPSAPALVLGLALVGALVLVAALGFELRVTAALRVSTSLLVTLNALVIGLLGAGILEDGHGLHAAGLFVAGLAGAHGLLGTAVLAHRRAATEIGLLVLAVGLVAADTAFAMLASGPTLALGWAASAVVMAALGVRARWPREIVIIAFLAQLALAGGHTFFIDAPVDALGARPDGLLGASLAVAGIAVAAFACARLSADDEELRNVLDGVALASLAYVTALVLGGTPLVLAWAAEAAALVGIGRWWTKDAGTRVGALPFVGLAALHVLVFEAQPEALVYGVSDLGAAALAGLAVVAATALAWAAWPKDEERLRLALLGASLLGVVYVASVGIVDAFQPGPTAPDTGVGVGVRQEGQAVLSAFWTLTGLVALWLGLRRRVREPRLAGFGLLALATGKVFLYDLSTLSSAWRVLSFVVLGLLLLVAALTYQRATRRNGGLTPS